MSKSIYQRRCKPYVIIGADKARMVDAMDPREAMRAVRGEIPAPLTVRKATPEDVVKFSGVK